MRRMIVSASVFPGWMRREREIERERERERER